MAIATVPSLGGTALPAPKAQDYTRLYRGGSLQMANGKTVHDLVDATARHRFTLRFEYISNTQLNTITTAWDAIKNATATYVSVRNTSHTVTRPEDGELDVTPVVTVAGDLKFHVSMELIEDS